MRGDLLCAAACSAVLLAASPALRAADADAVLHAALAAGGMKNPLHENLQRPVDARLLKIEAQGTAGCGLFKGEVHTARNAGEVRTLSGKLKPGNQLVLAGSDWKDARFSFGGTGPADAPILIRPENPGSAVLTGEAEIAFFGSHLIIAGLEFRDVRVAKTNSVIFRLGSGKEKPADHCIVNRVTMENCGSTAPEDWPRARIWLMNTLGMIMRGHSDDAIRQVLGGNVMRVLRANTPA